MGTARGSGIISFEIQGFFPQKKALLCFRYRSVRSILLNACDTVHAACLRLITFARSDDLAVGSFQAETEFTLLIVVNLKLRMLSLFEAFYGLILDVSGNGILTNALDTVLAGLLAGIYFACCNNFTIAGLQIELDTAGNRLDNKFTHNTLPPEFSG